MSVTEHDKQLCRDCFKAFLAADNAWWQAHIAPGFQRHDPGLPFKVIGPDGVKMLAEALLPGIPDMQLPMGVKLNQSGRNARNCRGGR